MCAWPALSRVRKIRLNRPQRHHRVEGLQAATNRVGLLVEAHRQGFKEQFYKYIIGANGILRNYSVLTINKFLLSQVL